MDTEKDYCPDCGTIEPDRCNNCGARIVCAGGTKGECNGCNTSDDE